MDFQYDKKCHICLGSSNSTLNPIYTCTLNGCDTKVHKGCYGILNSDINSWTCQRCKEFGKPLLKTCEICPVTKGPLKKTIKPGWIHVICAIFLPDAYFLKPDLMEKLSYSQTALQESSDKACYICLEKHNKAYAQKGMKLICHYEGCNVCFHATCGLNAGQLAEELIESTNIEKKTSHKYVGYCNQHRRKLQKRARGEGLFNTPLNTKFFYHKIPTRYKRFSEPSLTPISQTVNTKKSEKQISDSYAKKSQEATKLDSFPSNVMKDKNNSNASNNKISVKGSANTTISPNNSEDNNFTYNNNGKKSAPSTHVPKKERTDGGGHGLTQENKGIHSQGSNSGTATIKYDNLPSLPYKIPKRRTEANKSQDDTLINKKITYKREIDSVVISGDSRTNNHKRIKKEYQKPAIDTAPNNVPENRGNKKTIEGPLDKGKKVRLESKTLPPQDHLLSVNTEDVSPLNVPKVEKLSCPPLSSNTANADFVSKVSPLAISQISTPATATTTTSTKGSIVISSDYFLTAPKNYLSSANTPSRNKYTSDSIDSEGERPSNPLTKTSSKNPLRHTLPITKPEQPDAKNSRDQVAGKNHQKEGKRHDGLSHIKEAHSKNKNLPRKHSLSLSSSNDRRDSIESPPTPTNKNISHEAPEKLLGSGPTSNQVESLLNVQLPDPTPDHLTNSATIPEKYQSKLAIPPISNDKKSYVKDDEVVEKRGREDKKKQRRSSVPKENDKHRDPTNDRKQEPGASESTTSKDSHKTHAHKRVRSETTKAPLTTTIPPASDLTLKLGTSTTSPIAKKSTIPLLIKDTDVDTACSSSTKSHPPSPSDKSIPNSQSLGNAVGDKSADAKIRKPVVQPSSLPFVNKSKRPLEASTLEEVQDDAISTYFAKYRRFKSGPSSLPKLSPEKDVASTSYDNFLNSDKPGGDVKIIVADGDIGDNTKEVILNPSLTADIKEIVHKIEHKVVPPTSEVTSKTEITTNDGEKSDPESNVSHPASLAPLQKTDIDVIESIYVRASLSLIDSETSIKPISGQNEQDITVYTPDGTITSPTCGRFSHNKAVVVKDKSSFTPESHSISDILSISTVATLESGTTTFSLTSSHEATPLPNENSAQILDNVESVKMGHRVKGKPVFNMAKEGHTFDKVLAIEDMQKITDGKVTITSVVSDQMDKIDPQPISKNSGPRGLDKSPAISTTNGSLPHGLVSKSGEEKSSCVYSHSKLELSATLNTATSSRHTQSIEKVLYQKPAPLQFVDRSAEHETVTYPTTRSPLYVTGEVKSKERTRLPHTSASSSKSSKKSIPEPEVGEEFLTKRLGETVTSHSSKVFREEAEDTNSNTVPGLPMPLALTLASLYTSPPHYNTGGGNIFPTPAMLHHHQYGGVNSYETGLAMTNPYLFNGPLAMQEHQLSALFPPPPNPYFDPANVYHLSWAANAYAAGFFGPMGPAAAAAAAASGLLFGPQNPQHQPPLPHHYLPFPAQHHGDEMHLISDDAIQPSMINKDGRRNEIIFEGAKAHSGLHHTLDNVEGNFARHYSTKHGSRDIASGVKTPPKPLSEDDYIKLYGTTASHAASVLGESHGFKAMVTKQTGIEGGTEVGPSKAFKTSSTSHSPSIFTTRGTTSKQQQAKVLTSASHISEVCEQELMLAPPITAKARKASGGASHKASAHPGGSALSVKKRQQQLSRVQETIAAVAAATSASVSYPKFNAPTPESIHYNAPNANAPAIDTPIVGSGGCSTKTKLPTLSKISSHGTSLGSVTDAIDPTISRTIEVSQVIDESDNSTLSLDDPGASERCLPSRTIPYFNKHQTSFPPATPSKYGGAVTSLPRLLTGQTYPGYHASDAEIKSLARMEFISTHAEHMLAPPLVSAKRTPSFNDVLNISTNAGVVSSHPMLQQERSQSFLYPTTCVNQLSGLSGGPFFTANNFVGILEPRSHSHTNVSSAGSLLGGKMGMGDPNYISSPNSGNKKPNAPETWENVIQAHVDSFMRTMPGEKASFDLNTFLQSLAAQVEENKVNEAKLSKLRMRVSQLAIENVQLMERITSQGGSDQPSTTQGCGNSTGTHHTLCLSHVFS